MKYLRSLGRQPISWQSSYELSIRSLISLSDRESAMSHCVRGNFQLPDRNYILMSLPQTSPPLILQMFPLKSRNHITYTQLAGWKCLSWDSVDCVRGEAKLHPVTASNLLGRKLGTNQLSPSESTARITPGPSSDTRTFIFPGSSLSGQFISVIHNVKCTM